MVRKYYRIILLSLISLVISVNPISGNALTNSLTNPLSNMIQAIENGNTSIHFRTRQEYAKQPNLLAGHAFTIKSALTYQSEYFYKNIFCLEMINVAHFLGQKYNPNVSPFKRLNYSIINDPKGTGITLANIASEHVPHTDVIIGRQYISLDNGRMVGSNPFRQFPISFDAITIKNSFFNDFDIFYGFANHINTSNNSLTIEGRRKIRANLINITWYDFTYGKIIGYLYNNQDLTIYINSNSTFGGKIIADDTFKKIFNFGYEVELAKQKSNYNNRNKYSTIYMNLALYKDHEKLFNNWLITGKIGCEVLGGHHNVLPGYCMNFPLGNTHGFNGLAEFFVITPARGLLDYYSQIKADNTGSLGLELAGELHLFQFIKGTSKQFIGIELDLAAIFKITKNINSELVFAKLKGNEKQNNASRFSFSISYSAN